MSLVPTKTSVGHQAGTTGTTFVVWNDSLYSGDASGTIKQWNHEGVCVKTLVGHQRWVTTFVVWNDSLFSGSYKEIKQWNHEGVCVKTFVGHEGYVNTLVVWNDSLYSGSLYGTIKQWVNEEWERERKRINMRNLLLVYSISAPELDEDIAKEIATYF